MSRTFSCPHCKKPIELTDEDMRRGRTAGQVECPLCHVAIKVKTQPAPSGAAAPSTPGPSPFGSADLGGWPEGDDPLAIPRANVAPRPAPLPAARPFPGVAPPSSSNGPSSAARVASAGKASSTSPALKMFVVAGAVGALALGLVCCGGGVLALTMSEVATTDVQGNDRAANDAATTDAQGSDRAANDAGAADEPLPPAIDNFPPTPWTVTVAPPSEGPAMADVVDAGTDRAVIFLPGCRDRFIRQGAVVERSLTSGSTYEWLLVAFDPATGQPVGEPVSLGNEVQSRAAVGFDVPHRADMSPDGTLAIQTHGKTEESYSRVSILEPGATELRRLDSIPTYQDWFGWAKDGRLLVLREGMLSFWEVDGTEPALSVGEKYDLPVAMTPARDIVFVTVDDRYLEAIDAATGEVRGRLGARGGWKFLEVSPDGSRLAGVQWAEGWTPAPSSSPPEGRYDVTAFDLATGQEIASVRNRSFGPPAIWAGPNHVYHDGKIFDFETRSPVVALTLPAYQKPDFDSAEVGPLPSPDGRAWWTFEFGQAFHAPFPLEPRNGLKAFDSRTPVKVEVISFDPDRVGQVENAATAALASEGRAIGDGEWTVRIQLDRSESDVLLYDDQSTMKAPRIEGEMELVAPEGTVVSTIYFGGSFNRDKTAYLVAKDDKDWRNPDTTIYRFDFGGLDPSQAILKECWVQTIDVLKSIKRLPIVWQVDGKYVELPAPLALEIPAGVRTQAPGAAPKAVPDSRPK